ncbi:MAG: hypothetical protein BWY71_00617 [Planctomycetes bacterium ADurb.Bin412]|nr:MAG: hypothetical protein BWY71_00617 [Planctomycetes bacterium ADurb.Bin412]
MGEVNQQERRQQGAEGNDAGFLGSMGQADKHAGQQNPDEFAAAEVAIAGGDDAAGEADQEDFLDIVAAVIDEGGRNGKEDGTEGDDAAAQAGYEPQMEYNQQDPEEDRDDTEEKFVDLGNFLRAGQPGGDEGEVVEGGAVVFVVVVDILMKFEKPPKLDSMDGFIGMHRA